jgi:hypothetical protein
MATCTVSCIYMHGHVFSSGSTVPSLTGPWSAVVRDGAACYLELPSSHKERASVDAETLSNQPGGGTTD